MKLIDIVSEYFTGSETRKIYGDYRCIVEDIYENYKDARTESYKWERLDIGLSKKVPNYMSCLGVGLGILGFWPVAGLIIVGSECLRNISSYSFMLIRRKIFNNLEKDSSEIIEEYYKEKVKLDAEIIVQEKLLENYKKKVEEKKKKEEKFPFDTSGYEFFNPDNY